MQPALPPARRRDRCRVPARDLPAGAVEMPTMRRTVSEIRSRAEGYEKTDDVSEKTSLADQEEVRTIFINQPQLTKFCNNHVRNGTKPIMP